jgi:hypothetical protein
MQISDAESIVMEVLWQRSPRCAERSWPNWRASRTGRSHDQDPAQSPADQGRDPRREGRRRYLYAPVLKREDWVHGQSRSLLDRLFDGAWRRSCAFQREGAAEQEGHRRTQAAHRGARQ